MTHKITHIDLEVAKDGNYGYGYRMGKIFWDVDPVQLGVSQTSIQYVSGSPFGVDGCYKSINLHHDLPPYKYTWTFHRQSPATLECNDMAICPWDATSIRIKTYVDISPSDHHCPSCTCKQALEEQAIALNVTKFIGRPSETTKLAIPSSKHVSHIVISWGYDEGFSLGEIVR